MAVKKVYNCSFDSPLVGVSGTLSAITYYDQFGSIVIVPISPINLNDTAAITAALSVYSWGKYDYTYSGDRISGRILKSPFHLSSLELDEVLSDGTHITNSIFIEISKEMYMNDPSDVYGCVDSNATNFDPDANISSDVCTYIPESNEDVLLSDYKEYALKRTKKDYSGGCVDCCCENSKEQYVSRILIAGQRIFNNTTEVAPEVKATASLDFSSFDVSQLANNQSIEVAVTKDDSSFEPIILTTFTEDMFGLTIEQLLTLIALNINLDSPDFSCSYSGSGTTLEIIAADGYGQELNDASVNIYFVDYFGAGTEWDTLESYNPGSPVIVGNYMYIPDMTTPGRIHRVLLDSETLPTPTYYDHSKATAISSWAKAIPKSSYATYKRNLFVGHSGDTYCKSVKVVSGGALDGSTVFGHGGTTVAVRMPNGTTSLAPGALGPFYGIGIISQSWGVQILAVNSPGGGPGNYVLYSYDGTSWTNSGSISSASIGASYAPDIVYHAGTKSFYFATGSTLIKLHEPSNTITTLVLPSGNAGVMTLNETLGILYASVITSPGLTGFNEVYPIDLASFTLGTTIVIGDDITGKIGKKEAPSTDDTRYYACKYGTSTVLVYDGNWLEVDHFDIELLEKVASYNVGCFSDEINNLLVLQKSSAADLVGTPVVTTGVIEPESKEVVNILGRIGYQAYQGRGTVGFDSNGTVAVLMQVGFNHNEFEYLYKPNIVGQIMMGGTYTGGTNYRLDYFDILPDGSLEESAFELETDTVNYGQASVDFDNEYVYIMPYIGIGVIAIRYNQTGYNIPYEGWRANTYFLPTGNTLTGIYNPRGGAINPINGNVVFFGADYAVGQKCLVELGFGTAYTPTNVAAKFTSLGAVSYNSSGNLCVAGVQSGDIKIEIFDNSYSSIITGFTVGLFTGGQLNIAYDSDNNQWLVNNETQGKVYVVKELAGLTGVISTTLVYSGLTPFNDSGLTGLTGGVTYGIIRELSSPDKVHIYPIELIDAGLYTSVGSFSGGYDAILQTEDDECLTFEEVTTMIQNSIQLIKTC